MAHAAIELYEALKEAGVSNQKAKAAAEAVEGVREEERLRDIELKLESIQGELKLHRWMLAFILAANMAIFWMLIKMAMAHGG